MKRYVCILLMLALLLCGCTPADGPSIDASSSQVTESTGTETYAGTYMVIRYNVDTTYNYDGKPFDTNDMIDGALYAIDDGKVSLITTANATHWCFSDQNIYYRTDSRPEIVWQTNRNGGDYKEYFRIKNFQFSPDRIIHIQFTEKLLIKLETYNYDKLLASRIVAAETPDTPLVRAYQIDSFTYASSSTAFPEVSAHISNEDLGATIRWTGNRNGNNSTYYSFIDKDECWDAATWEQVGYPQPTSRGWADKQDGALYYLDDIKEETHLVFDGPVIAWGNSYESVFFVKEAEPTKIYAAPIADLTQHRVIYESPVGAINFIYTDTYRHWKDVLQFVEGNKRFVWMDLTKGETEVLMEQYYIEKAVLSAPREGFLLSPAESWRDFRAIWFVGKLNEDEALEEYTYFIDTGKVS